MKTEGQERALYVILAAAGMGTGFDVPVYAAPKCSEISE
jgi:hypothetical protein